THHTPRLDSERRNPNRLNAEDTRFWQAPLCCCGFLAATLAIWPHRSVSDFLLRLNYAHSSRRNQKIRRLSVRFLYSQMPVAAAPPARAPITAPFLPLTIPPVAAPAPAPMPMTVAAPAGPSIHLCL